MSCEVQITPTYIEDPCGGEVKDVRCVQDSSAYIDLAIVANSNQGDINQAVYNALQASKSTTDELQTQFDEIRTEVDGIIVSSITIPNDINIASALNEGKLRYYVSGNNSYLDICMKIGASSYQWTNILQQNY